MSKDVSFPNGPVECSDDCRICKLGASKSVHAESPDRLALLSFACGVKRSTGRLGKALRHLGGEAASRKRALGKKESAQNVRLARSLEALKQAGLLGKANIKAFGEPCAHSGDGRQRRFPAWRPRMNFGFNSVEEKRTVLQVACLPAEFRNRPLRRPPVGMKQAGRLQVAFNQGVDKANFECGNGIDRMRTDQQVKCSLKTQQSREKLRAAECCQQAQPHFRKAKACSRERDPIIGTVRNDHAATQYVAVHGSDDGLRRGSAGFRKVKKSCTFQRPIKFGDIGAGEKGSACAKHKDCRRIALGHFIHCDDKPVPNGTAKCIHRGVVHDNHTDVAAAHTFHGIVHATGPIVSNLV